MEVIGLFIGLVILGGIAVIIGALIGATAWLIFWGRKRPKLLIFALAAIPVASLVYLVAMAVCMEIFVPNQPDFLFGDLNEPLGHGYVLTGLGKMPEYSYIDSTPSMMHQPPLRGGIRRLEQDGEVVYGAYGHINEEDSMDTDHDHGYFIFDTRTGHVTDIASLEQLQAAAGHPLNLVESEYFRSQSPGRILLRRIEDGILYAPPCVAFIVLVIVLVRKRLDSRRLVAPAQDTTIG